MAKQNRKDWARIGADGAEVSATGRPKSGEWKALKDSPFVGRDVFVMVSENADARQVTYTKIRELKVNPDKNANVEPAKALESALKVAGKTDIARARVIMRGVNATARIAAKDGQKRQDKLVALFAAAHGCTESEAATRLAKA